MIGMFSGVRDRKPGSPRMTVQHDPLRACVETDRLQVLNRPGRRVTGGVSQTGGRACADAVVHVDVSVGCQPGECGRIVRHVGNARSPMYNNDWRLGCGGSPGDVQRKPGPIR